MAIRPLNALELWPILEPSLSGQTANRNPGGCCPCSVKCAPWQKSPWLRSQPPSALLKIATALPGNRLFPMIWRPSRFLAGNFSTLAEPPRTKEFVTWAAAAAATPLTFARCARASLKPNERVDLFGRAASRPCSGDLVGRMAYGTADAQCHGRRREHPAGALPPGC